MQSANLFEARNHALKTLIAAAYEISPAAISGGPAWADSERWDILAKTPGEARPTLPEQMTMLRSLLSERFRLSVHEKKSMSIYMLTIAKDGPKLRTPADKFRRFACRRAAAGVPFGVGQCATTGAKCHHPRVCLHGARSRFGSPDRGPDGPLGPLRFGPGVHANQSCSAMPAFRLLATRPIPISSRPCNSSSDCSWNRRGDRFKPS